MTSPPPSRNIPKLITGYADRWSVRAGESVTVYGSSHRPGQAELSLVKIDCGDPTSAGPGFSEHEVETNLPSVVELADQPLVPGSWASIELCGLPQPSDTPVDKIRLTFSFLATVAGEPQSLASVVDPSGAACDLVVGISPEGQATATVGNSILVLRQRPIVEQRWYDVDVTWSLAANTVKGTACPRRTVSPGRDLLEPAEDPYGIDIKTTPGGPTPAGPTRLILGGNRTGADCDGRIATPALTIGLHELRWDLAADMAGSTVVDASGHGCHGTFYQLPTRAVTGPDWDGTYQRWTDHPPHWDAVHFHKDELYDAGWEPTATVDLPEDLPSGIYAFRFRCEPTDGEAQPHEDRIPIFVRPAVGKPTAQVAVLMSSATYLAYANHRMLFEGANFIASRSSLRPEHDYIRAHPELGRSMYEEHADGSGVMFSSRLRPVLNLRPGADGWNFTPDTDINAFVEHTGVGHDIIGDEDIHAEGAQALAPYRVIVTSSHPEYWSTNMLNALESWQKSGGRLMYLGGNGFYWRVAFSDAWPGAMELRRAEDGVRNWQTGDGESYHAFGGEYGGLWRRLGRAPNNLVGVGFAAQGFDKAVPFDVNESTLNSRAAWIWDGVDIEDGKIGTSGLGGGAAGQEIDRYDTRLGSPEHGLVLASATKFDPDMIRTKEEFGGSVSYPDPDPYVRADIVFYETPGGGAVFSASSISWFGALARGGYDNSIAQMTTNVLTRFADPEPFPIPDQQD